MKTFKVNLEKNENHLSIKNLIDTAKEKSKKETIYLICNGIELQIIHKDYVEEFKNEGYWVSQIYENGHICEI